MKHVGLLLLMLICTFALSHAAATGEADSTHVHYPPSGSISPKGELSVIFHNLNTFGQTSYKEISIEDPRKQTIEGTDFDEQILSLTLNDEHLRNRFMQTVDESSNRSLALADIFTLFNKCVENMKVESLKKLSFFAILISFSTILPGGSTHCAPWKIEFGHDECINTIPTGQHTATTKEFYQDGSGVLCSSSLILIDPVTLDWTNLYTKFPHFRALFEVHTKEGNELLTKELTKLVEEEPRKICIEINEQRIKTHFVNPINTSSTCSLQ